VRHSRLLLLLFVASAGLAADSFSIHSFHAAKLGRLDCNLCHVAASKGSVELKRPGHDQCKLCHVEAFQARAVPGRLCAQCHSSAAPSGRDVSQFPRLQNVLIDFSHARHVDPKTRSDSSTGFRSDCVFCHSAEPRLPSHTQCAVCHSKAGMKPELTPFLRTAGCRGCHNPEEGRTSVLAAKYSGIRFSHTAHFAAKLDAKLDCTTCHSSIPASTSIADQALPRMADCAGCHDTRRVAAALRISNCGACHTTVAVSAVAANFDRNVKPEFHTDAFRLHHEEAAAAPGAKCFACHQNSLATAAVKDRCVSCHMIMKPVSHTARWKDDIHGKWAALDRTACATCHAADYCTRCHNELPRSHAPLPIFKAGGHANLAMLNNRACFTCHTFENTCASCHVRGFRPGATKH
jgi:Cytochrome c7 and related cytochrome c